MPNGIGIERIENKKLSVSKMVNTIEPDRVKNISIDDLVAKKKISVRCFTNINYLKEINNLNEEP